MSFRPLLAGRGTEMLIGSFTSSSTPSLANRWTEMAATGVSSNLRSDPVRGQQGGGAEERWRVTLENNREGITCGRSQREKLRGTD